MESMAPQQKQRLMRVLFIVSMVFTLPSLAIFGKEAGGAIVTIVQNWRLLFGDAEHLFFQFSDPIEQAAFVVQLQFLGEFILQLILILLTCIFYKQGNTKWLAWAVLAFIVSFFAY